MKHKKKIEIDRQAAIIAILAFLLTMTIGFTMKTYEDLQWQIEVRDKQKYQMRLEIESLKLQVDQMNELLDEQEEGK